MKEREKNDFSVKVSEHDYTMILTYDKSGGMRIIRKSSLEHGKRKYQEVYLPKEAMLQLAYQLLQKNY